MRMIDASLGSLRDIQPNDYTIRFLFEGLCTVVAGWIAKRWGPEIGGLFLAFPALFPAGASLLERHERDKKQKAGFDGTRGRVVAGIDAIGASIGCIGLVAFAATLWIGLPAHNPYLMTAAATALWGLVSHMVLCRLMRMPARRLTIARGFGIGIRSDGCTVFANDDAITGQKSFVLPAVLTHNEGLRQHSKLERCSRVE